MNAKVEGKMKTRYVTCTIALLILLPVLGAAQTDEERESGRSIHRDGWDRIAPEGPLTEKSAPAPIRDLSGIWEPTPRYRDGVQNTGARNMPSDGRPEHELPFTPLGLQTWKSHKPGWGVTAVPTAELNDPFAGCDPIGFPRIELFNLRAMQIWQNKNQVQIVFQNSQVWRNIWADGRELPKEILESRWYGYSVGKWIDDYTFVAQTTGLDERTWIDNAGRPHSDQLTVQETFHRVNKDILELTLTINDPKMYTKPWTALDKFPLRLQPEWFDIREQVCAPSEATEFQGLMKEAAEEKKK
jgi:hypothetical protein